MEVAMDTQVEVEATPMVEGECFLFTPLSHLACYHYGGVAHAAGFAASTSRTVGSKY